MVTEKRLFTITYRGVTGVYAESAEEAKYRFGVLSPEEEVLDVREDN